MTSQASRQRAPQSRAEPARQVAAPLARLGSTNVALLQRTLGNQALQRALAPRRAVPVQRKVGFEIETNMAVAEVVGHPSKAELANAATDNNQYQRRDYLA